MGAEKDANKEKDVYYGKMEISAPFAHVENV